MNLRSATIEKSQNKPTPTIIFLLFIGAILFSPRIPIPVIGARHASINLEDILILLLGILTAYYIYRQHEFKIYFPELTTLLILSLIWITFTVLVAFFRSTEPVTASALWTIKWFEVVAFFIITPFLLMKSNIKIIYHSLTPFGILFSITALIQYWIYSPRRLDAWFGNPNALASMAALFSIYFFALILVSNRTTVKLSYLVFWSLPTIVVFFTQSRSGMICLITGMALVLFILRNDLLKKDLYFIPGIILAAISSYIYNPDSYRRFIYWIEFSNGRILLSESNARPFLTRFRLLGDAIELFIQKPFIGYGWFASPSRVGYLDVYYTILLVELGIIGFILFAFIYLIHGRYWISLIDTNQQSLLAVVGIAWYLGILLQGIAGSFPRMPRIAFMLYFVFALSYCVQRSYSKNNIKLFRNRG